jgi:hypothetical protein
LAGRSVRDLISQKACYNAPVHRLVLICMCLMACLSFGRGSVAHAMAPDFAEFVVGADCMAQHRGELAHKSSCSVDHKAATHHHAACHGHKIGIPPAAEELIFAEDSVPAFTPILHGLGPDARPDTATRPPNA